MDIALLENLLFAMVRSGTPLLFCGLGVLICERAGVLNLGQEGMMLMGAVVSFIVTYSSGNAGLGILAGTLAGIATSALFAFIALFLRANQVATGLALSIFGAGLAAFVGAPYVGETIQGLSALQMPLLADIPLLGRVLFAQDFLVYLSWVMAILVFLVSQRWRAGILIRAVGENPQVARKLGVPVQLIRYLAVFFGGAMAGLSGAYLSLSYTPLWAEGISAGRGWIALALVVFASWRTGRLMLGAYLFGLSSILHLLMQGFGFAVSPNLLAMTPYLVTILVLILLSRPGKKRNKVLAAPASLGKVYLPEAH